MLENPSIRYGMAAGLGTVAILLIAYAFDKAAMLNPLIHHSTWVFYIGAMWMSVVAWKKSTEFKDLLRQAFLCFLLANLIFHGFYYLIHQYDPELTGLHRAAMEAWLPKVTPKSELAKKLRELEHVDFSIYLGDVAFGYARGAIAGFALAALMAKLRQSV